MNNYVNNHWRNILIIGAGELGMAVIKGFCAQRESHPEIRLTVLLRPQSASQSAQQRAEQLARWDIGILTADFNAVSIGELAQLFTPYDAIINCSGFVGGMGTQIKITEAVLLAKVARYFPWQFGVDYDRIGENSGQPVWDEQLAVRSLLRAQQQTQWVIVSTGMFTSFLFEADFGVVNLASRTVHALGDAEFALTLTTPEDIGRLTASLFFHTPAISNEVIYIAGDTLTYTQLTALLGQHFATDFTCQVERIATLKAANINAPHDRYAAYRLAFAREDGVSWPMVNTYNYREGIEVTSVKQWLVQEKMK